MLAALCLWCAGAAAHNAATKSPATQSPTTQNPVALLYDPSGAPVTAATGWLQPEPSYRLAALPQPLPGPLAGVTPTPTPLEARSDDRGLLRFESEQPIAVGSGYCTTDAGLGALLVQLRAGRAQRLTLHPLGLVTTATGSEPFELVARAHLGDGATVTLPPMRGSEVRLPAGDYEIWARSADGIVWQRLRVAAGARALLQFLGDAERVEVPAGSFVQPSGWPAWPFGALDGGGDGAAVLRGAAGSASLLAWHDGLVASPRELAEHDASRTRVRHRIDDAPDGTRVIGLVGRRDGSFAVRAWADVHDGEARLPAPPAGDTWLLLAAPGRAPAARRWTQADTPAWSAARGVAMTIEARDDGNLPVVDLLLDYVPDDGPAATVQARTDARGAARFGRVLGPGLLRVSDPRFENRDIELSQVPSEPFEIRVATGSSCRVRARFADGEADGAIVVTLRDPRGLLRPAERAQSVRPGATATFEGLPERADVVLFATAQRGRHTWSVRRRVRIDAFDGDAVELVLEDEDPQLR